MNTTLFFFSPSITVTSLMPGLFLLNLLVFNMHPDREGHTIYWLERTMVFNAELEQRIS